MRVVIFSNGQVENYEFYKNILGQDDYIICADGGLRHAVELDIIPDLIVGDLDSAKPEQVEEMAAKGVTVLRYPSKKDKTDTHIAVDLAVEKGAQEILLIGAMGDRFDHTLANLFLLSSVAEKGIKVRMLNEKNDVYIITDKVSLNGKKGDLVSLLALTPEVTGVTTKGLYYPLEKASLTIGFPVGISNVFVEEKVEINVEKGLLLVIMSKD
ncbi:MAG: thiamine pyrophosphokinae [Thermosediminibacterales bacterium]|nr:thiamine pyrophosphokinae [Thermosediminibacterales bacterium]MDK2836763.1 thiamine pyrophosphokinae [Thermosediminibacterales bacterium]